MKNLMKHDPMIKQKQQNPPFFIFHCYLVNYLAHNLLVISQWKDFVFLLGLLLLTAGNFYPLIWIMIASCPDFN